MNESITTPDQDQPPGQSVPKRSASERHGNKPPASLTGDIIARGRENLKKSFTAQSLTPAAGSAQVGAIRSPSQQENASPRPDEETSRDRVARPRFLLGLSKKDLSLILVLYSIFLVGLITILFL